MVVLESSMHVPGMQADAVLHFFLHPTDAVYRRWWPGTHFRMHPLNDTVGVGQIVYMDEMIGDRRLRLSCEVVFLGPERITWQFRRIVTLPAWLDLRVAEAPGGAIVTHTIRAGYRGLGVLLDPLFRLYFSRRFAQMMHDHFTAEFSTLPAVLERESA
jgi:hypothetical protein